MTKAGIQYPKSLVKRDTAQSENHGVHVFSRSHFSVFQPKPRAQIFFPKILGGLQLVSSIKKVAESETTAQTRSPPPHPCSDVAFLGIQSINMEIIITMRKYPPRLFSHSFTQRSVCILFLFSEVDRRGPYIQRLIDMLHQHGHSETMNWNRKANFHLKS